MEEQEDKKENNNNQNRVKNHAPCQPNPAPILPSCKANNKQEERRRKKKEMRNDAQQIQIER